MEVFEPAESGRIEAKKPYSEFRPFFGRRRGPPAAFLRERFKTAESGSKWTSSGNPKSQQFLSVEEGPQGLVSERSLRGPNQA